MGRRSINTTKSGKYMNPTDQARKEARKKELKKNKRQRQMVRAAVLKGKDPGQILDEMEKIDEMEYNVLQPSPLNEKVLREKRKKLKETFDRVMRLYHNDDPELWADLKRKEVDYEKKRLKKQQYYESVKSAQSVQIDEIPLPQMNIPQSGGPQIPGSLNRVPPPSALQIPPFIPDIHQGNSNKFGDPNNRSIEKTSEKKKKDSPGCPPGPPPDLTKFRELDSDAEDDTPLQELQKKAKSKKCIEDDEKLISKDDEDSSKSSSLQQRMVQMSGQNIDAFMKEIENVQRNSIIQDSKENSDKNSEKSSGDENDINDDIDDDDDDLDDDDESENSENSEDDDEQPKITGRKMNDKEQSNLSIPLPPIPPPPPAMGMPGGPPPPPIGMPPAMMFRPPPMRPGGSSGNAIPGITIRMPPGPPPGRPSMQMTHRMGIRMPPGPPPGMPPNRGGMHHHNQKGHHHNHPAKDSKGITTITAKPQIRNLSADVTRFVPSALRVKREDQKLPSAKRPKLYQQEIRPTESKKGATKDDAYMQFMREMQGLL